MRREPVKSITTGFKSPSSPSTDPAAALPAAIAENLPHNAEGVPLAYVTAGIPGYSRVPKGKDFRYLDTTAHVIRDKTVLMRLRKLAIPPAWSDVWICPDNNGHIQAIGRDARGRKQYIYHAAFRAAREDSKFRHLVAFAGALPRLRQQIRRDMARSRLDKRKVIATVTFLLEATLIRVGNSEYARANRSYGITTLRNPHVMVKGPAIRFKFRGKSGKLWNLQLSSRRAANIVRACQELPGQLLFQYQEADGGLSPVSSTDINSYLREVTGKDITAKDYRTWAGTVLAAKMLHEIAANQEAPTITARKRQLREVIKEVAFRLGNTPTICRKCYIHPQIQDCFLAGNFKLKIGRGSGAERGDNALDAYEKAVLSLLKKATG